MIDVGRLIDLVKKYQLLYDTRHKDYKNTSRKTATWELIAKELKTTSQICRLKWKTVRDGYIKYKRMLQNSDGAKEIDYIWSNHLKFLDDVTRPKYCHSSANRDADLETQVREDVTYEVEVSPSPPPLAFKEIDATDLLFLSYSGTFKKFSARQQIFLKLELAKLFASVELQHKDNEEQFKEETAETCLPIIIKTEFSDTPLESEMQVEDPAMLSWK